MMRGYATTSRKSSVPWPLDGGRLIVGVATTLPWGEMVASALSAGGLTQLLNWFTNRSKAQAYSQGMVDRALEKALKGVSDQLTRADMRIQAVEAHRDQCERELADGRRERAELLARLDELMAGRIARIGEQAP